MFFFQKPRLSFQEDLNIEQLESSHHVGSAIAYQNNQTQSDLQISE